MGVRGRGDLRLKGPRDLFLLNYFVPVAGVRE